MEMDYITVSRLLIVPVIGVARGFPEGPCPPNVQKIWSFCALGGVFPNKIVLFA